MEEEIETDVLNSCRLCLVNNKEGMIPIDAEIVKFCGISLRDNPDFPKRICTNCNAILQFIQKFRKMCENSDAYLREFCCKETNTKESNDTKVISEQRQKEQQQLLEEQESMESFQDEEESHDISVDNIGKEEEVQVEDEDTREYLYEIGTVNEGDHHVVNIVEGADTENENETTDEVWIEEPCDHDETIYIVEDSNSITIENGKLLQGQIITKSKSLRIARDVEKSVIGNKKEKQASNERHVCEICGNYYKRLGALETHRRRHLNQRPFECELCGVTFNFNFLLERHMRKHTGDRPFTCEYCDRKFVDRSTMSRHQKIHRNERAYKCDICGKCFTYYSVLKTHIMSHTGEKPYTCGICKKGFHRASDLKNHLETLQHRQDPRAAALIREIKSRNC